MSLYVSYMIFLYNFFDSMCIYCVCIIGYCVYVLYCSVCIVFVCMYVSVPPMRSQEE